MYQNTVEGVAVKIEWITPALAREYLQSNTHNRPLKDSRSRKLRREMEQGRWRFNGETIKLDRNGVLLDAQHRLHALAQLRDESISIPFIVVRGLDPRSQRTMDQGTTRGAADQLVLDQIVRRGNASTVAAAIRVWVPWTQGLLFRNTSTHAMSNTAVTEWAENNPELVESMLTISGRGLRGVRLRPALATAILVRFQQLDPVNFPAFEERLVLGLHLTDGDPVLALRDRLDRLRDDRTNATDRELIGYCVLAWNAWQAGRTISKLQAPRGGWSEANFPSPVSPARKGQVLVDFG